MEQDEVLIRAGAACTIPRGGTVKIDIQGMFTLGDAEDAIAILKMVSRSVQRQIDEHAKKVQP